MKCWLAFTNKNSIGGYIMDKFKEMFHKIGFWFLVMFLTGFLSGNWAMNNYRDKRMEEARKIGAFIYNQQIYEMKIRL